MVLNYKPLANTLFQRDLERTISQVLICEYRAFIEYGASYSKSCTSTDTLSSPCHLALRKFEQERTRVKTTCAHCRLT